MKVNLKQNSLVGGLSPTRRTLLRVIKLATKVDLHRDGIRFFSEFDHWIQHRGLRTSVLRLRAEYHCVLNWCLGQDAPTYPFLATSQGFPRRLLYLRRHCTSPEGVQAVLSLLAYWRGVRAPGIPDLGPITRPMTTVYPHNFQRLITGCLPDKWKIKLDGLSQVNHIFKTTFGPNGKAVYTALQDLKALQQDPELFQALKDMLELLGSEDFLENLEELEDQYEPDQLPEKVNHSRLSVKQELGGKDRVFAILDYWTQCTLKPFHKAVSRLLSTIPQDATFGQDTAADEIKTWTGKPTPVFSFDLTAATDRIPVQLQRAVVEKLTGSSRFADLWLTLMTKRDFVFRKISGIRYSVGQPMGAYSSWPVFALTHHLIVISAAKQANVSVPEYKILGDDICIRSEALARHYLVIMTSFGVEISKPKTVTGSVAEFAKRLFLKGREVTPIPVRLISAFLKDFRLIRELRDRLLLRGSLGFAEFFSVQTSLIELCSLFPEKQAEKARILLILPSQVVEGRGALLKQGGNTHLSVYQTGGPDWQLCCTLIRYKYLIERYTVEVHNASKLEKEISLPNKMKACGLPPEIRGLDTQLLDLHPMSQGVLNRKVSVQQAHRALGKYWTALTQLGSSAIRPNVNLPDLRDLNPSFRKRLKREADVLLTAARYYTEFTEWKNTHPEDTFREFYLARHISTAGRTL